MSNEPRYPDLNEKSLGEQVAELKDYIVNLHRYIRYADNNIAERNLTRTLEDKIHSYVDADGVVHILDELGFDSEVGFYNYVTFHNLQTEGETNINGDNITTGTILADYIDVDGIIAANGIVVTDNLKDGSTIISGSNILTGTIDTDRLNVGDIISNGNIVVINDLTDGTTQISGDNITTGTIDASRVTVTNIDADNINTGTLDADLIESSHNYGGSIGIITATFDDSYFKIEDDLGDVLLNIGYDVARDKMHINAGGMGQNGVLEINGVNTSIYGARSLDLSSQQGISIFGEPLEDFVVDEGTSNSWYYRIWYSGRMECWRRFSKTATAINTASGSLYTTSGNTTFDSYPYNFSAAPTVNMSLESAQGLMLAVTGTGTVSTPPNIKVMRTAAYTSSTTFYVDVHASGMKASS